MRPSCIPYGIEFSANDTTPRWLRMGTMRDCFNNATLYAVSRPDVWYVEGYASGPELSIPAHHAWLVDCDGKVVDPTWPGSRNNVYFGVPFTQDFVRSTLETNGGQAGILVNLHLLRRSNRGPGAFERVVDEGVLALGRGFYGLRLAQGCALLADGLR